MIDTSMAGFKGSSPGPSTLLSLALYKPLRSKVDCRRGLDCVLSGCSCQSLENTGALGLFSTRCPVSHSPQSLSCSWGVIAGEETLLEHTVGEVTPVPGYPPAGHQESKNPHHPHPESFFGWETAQSGKSGWVPGAVPRVLRDQPGHVRAAWTRGWSGGDKVSVPGFCHPTCLLTCTVWILR